MGKEDRPNFYMQIPDPHQQVVQVEIYCLFQPSSPMISAKKIGSKFQEKMSPKPFK